jgi:undecaprenyl-diphosphatase
MINEVNSTFLGIVQGLTEFLPISSSGHLVLFQNLLGFREPALLLDVSLHLGTLLAVCIYFRKDLIQMARETWAFFRDLSRGRKRFHQIHENPHAALLLWVVVGSVPTALIGLLFKDPLERLFGSLTLVGVMLMVTGLILAASKFLSRGNRIRAKVGLLAALAVGTVQGIAIIPGISRSGSTIVCGLFFGMERELAAKFSFLLSIPAIFGALLLQLRSEALGSIEFLPIFIGFFSSALVGLLALKVLMGMVRKGRLAYFAPYCWALGLLILFL